MSLNEFLTDFYHKKAPRWFKVIRWREIYARQLENTKWNTKFIFIPAFILYTCCCENPFALKLYLFRPKTEEEVELLRRNNHRDVRQRNWEIDQYEYQRPPVYDMWERRRKYPQYYAGRYENYTRDNWGVMKKEN